MDDPLECSPYLQRQPRTIAQAQFQRVVQQLQDRPTGGDRPALLEPARSGPTAP